MAIPDFKVMEDRLEKLVGLLATKHLENKYYVDLVVEAMFDLVSLNADGSYTVKIGEIVRKFKINSYKTTKLHSLTLCDPSDAVWSRRNMQ